MKDNGIYVMEENIHGLNKTYTQKCRGFRVKKKSLPIHISVSVSQYIITSVLMNCTIVVHNFIRTEPHIVKDHLTFTRQRQYKDYMNEVKLEVLKMPLFSNCKHRVTNTRNKNGYKFDEWALKY